MLGEVLEFTAGVGEAKINELYVVFLDKIEDRLELGM